MTTWSGQRQPDDDEEDEQHEDAEEEVDEEEFPEKLFVTMDKNEGDTAAFPLSSLTLEEAIGTERRPVAVAEYVLNKHFKARLKVEVLEEEE